MKELNKDLTLLRKDNQNLESLKNSEANEY